MTTLTGTVTLNGETPLPARYIPELKLLIARAWREMAPIVADDIYACDAVRALLYDTLPTLLADLEARAAFETRWLT